MNSCRVIKIVATFTLQAGQNYNKKKEKEEGKHLSQKEVTTVAKNNLVFKGAKNKLVRSLLIHLLTQKSGGLNLCFYICK